MGRLVMLSKRLRIYPILDFRQWDLALSDSRTISRKMRMRSTDQHVWPYVTLDAAHSPVPQL